MLDKLFRKFTGSKTTPLISATAPRSNSLNEALLTPPPKSADPATQVFPDIVESDLQALKRVVEALPLE